MSSDSGNSVLSTAFIAFIVALSSGCFMLKWHTFHLQRCSKYHKKKPLLTWSKAVFFDIFDIPQY